MLGLGVCECVVIQRAFSRATEQAVTWGILGGRAEPALGYVQGQFLARLGEIPPQSPAGQPRALPWWMHWSNSLQGQIWQSTGSSGGFFGTEAGWARKDYAHLCQEFGGCLDTSGSVHHCQKERELLPLVLLTGDCLGSLRGEKSVQTTSKGLILILFFSLFFPCCCCCFSPCAVIADGESA